MSYQNDAQELSGLIAAHAENMANMATRWLAQRDSLVRKLKIVSAEFLEEVDEEIQAIALVPDQARFEEAVKIARESLRK